MKNRLLSHKAFPFLFTLVVTLTAQACLALDPNAVTQPALAGDYRETTSLMTAIFKVMGSLAVVVGLMLILVFLFKKSGFSKGLSSGGSLINVLESRMVAPKKYIAIVEIANKCVAVGITDNSITMLTDVDNSFEPSATSPKLKKEVPSFPGLLKKAARSIGNKSGFAEYKKKEGKEGTDVQ